MGGGQGCRLGGVGWVVGWVAGKGVGWVGWAGRGRLRLGKHRHSETTRGWEECQVGVGCMCKTERLHHEYEFVVSAPTPVATNPSGHQPSPCLSARSLPCTASAFPCCTNVPGYNFASS